MIWWSKIKSASRFMTRNEIAAFLEKNGIIDFSFDGLKFVGNPKTVIFTINRIDLEVPFNPEDSLEQFKQDVEQAYLLKLEEVDPKKFESFGGISWRN
jgi:hypothetical protein